MAEAPTGIGKSLAYLLPAILVVRDSDRRVVIATCTKSLQDQLMDRDLPALLEALGLSIPCARLKGKQNYLCPQALDGAMGEGGEEDDVLEEVRRWAAAEESGDLDRFPAKDVEAFQRIRNRLGADPAACTTATCRRARECAWVRARRRASEARLVVVNHALLALASEADGLLPPFDLLVVDEAHRLEGVLLSQLERSTSRHRFEEALRLIGSGRRGSGGLAARIRGFFLPLFEDAHAADLEREVEEVIARVSRARDDVERFFAQVEPRVASESGYGRRERHRSASELLGAELEPLELLLSHCASFARSLALWSHRAGDPELPSDVEAPETLASELEHAATVWSGLGADLENLAEATDRSWVYWRSAGGRGVELHGCPVSVGDAARRLLTGRAAVLTSATLSTGGDFDFAMERLGLGETHGAVCETQSYPSPFPLDRQIRAFAWSDRSRDESDVVAHVVSQLAATGRSILVLFTAHERLRRARERLLPLLPAERRLLAQEWDGSASLVSERFRAERGAILLGVQSLWEGVDFPGESLEILVVAKLPFSEPDDPLVEARGERLMDRGLDPFRDDALPEAVLRFRQGVGRLIRRADDRGVLVVCDPRLSSASYREPFLRALPVKPQPMADAAQLASAASAFLASAHRLAEPVAEGA